MCYSQSIPIVAVVGFEQTSYTFNESDITGDVCILVTNPPMNEELVFRITLQTSAMDGTARMLQNLYNVANLLLPFNTVYRGIC